MCLKSESCELESRVNSIEDRVRKLESDVGELRAETRTGFSSVNLSIVTLSQQIANMDKRLVEEKERWGNVLRKIVLWTASSLIATACAAAGVNLAKSLNIFHFN